MRENIFNGMKIEALNMNATNLADLDDNYFDITLVLGPLYHLFDEDDIK